MSTASDESGRAIAFELNLRCTAPCVPANSPEIDRGRVIVTLWGCSEQVGCTCAGPNVQVGMIPGTREAKIPPGMGPGHSADVCPWKALDQVGNPCPHHHLMGPFLRGIMVLMARGLPDTAPH